MKRTTFIIATVVVLGAIVAPSASASRWQACGTVPGPVAHYNLKAKNANCGTAKKVSRKWNKKVLGGMCSFKSCKSVGYRCVDRNRKETEYYVAYRVVCKKRQHRVVWNISLD